MRVDDTLRVAGRAARVAHRRGGAFVDLRVRDTGLLGREQLVVAEHLRAVALERGGVGVAHDHVVLHARQVRRELRQRRHQRAVDDDDLVFRVVHDVGELVGEQADVERVEHAAHAGNGEVRLEMLLGVPREGRDPITRLDAEAAQRPRQLVDPVGHLRERGAAARVALERDHLAVAVDRAPVAEDHPDGEGKVLHRRQHRDLRASPAVRDSNGHGSVPGRPFVRHPPSFMRVSSATMGRTPACAPGITRRSSCGCPPS